MKKLLILPILFLFLGVDCSNSQQSIIDQQQKQIDELTEKVGDLQVTPTDPLSLFNEEEKKEIKPIIQPVVVPTVKKAEDPMILIEKCKASAKQQAEHNINKMMIDLWLRQLEDDTLTKSEQELYIQIGENKENYIENEYNKIYLNCLEQ